MGLDITWAVDWVRRSADVISEHRVELITLDREIGDGDHGENMDRGFQAVLPKLDDLPAGSTPGDVLKLVATTLISTVGGAAGPLYGTAYLKGAVAAGSETSLDGPAIAAVLTAARDGIVMRGKAESGDKTMVDAWTPAVDAADAAAASAPLPAADSAASTAGVQASIMVLSPGSALPRSTIPSRAAASTAATAAPSSVASEPAATAPFR